MTSIITVAGVSSRFNKDISESDKVLKCIYTDKDQKDTLLYHMMMKLSSSDRIVIVGGYKYEDLEKYIYDFLRPHTNTDIISVYNDHYRDLASGYSLYLGLNEALKKEQNQIIFVEGDLDIDKASVNRVLKEESNVCTYNHEPIYSDKAVVLYTDVKDRIHYAFNSEHGLLHIADSFKCILNSGQLWKLTDMSLLRIANDIFKDKYIDDTNLRIIQSYLDMIDSDNVKLIGLERWTNCNTRADYEKILGEWITKTC